MGRARSRDDASLHGEEVERAARAAQTFVLRQQAEDGSFPGTADLGPAFTAFPIIAMHYAGDPFAPEDLARFVAYFRAEQREDGSFEAYPYATRGDPCATAAVWAALRTAGLPPHDATVARAWAFLGEHGGLEAVARAFFTETNFAALFIAMAGHIEPSALPLPPPAVVLAEPVQRLFTGRFDYLNVVVALVAGGAIVDDLRRRGRPAARQVKARGLAARFFDAVTSAGSAFVQDDAAALAFLERFQNPNGALDDTSLQTALLVAAYRSLGLDRRDPRMARAVAWLRAMVVPRADGAAWISCFVGDVWGTGFAAAGLVALGASPVDAPLRRAARYLLDAQITDASRVACPMRKGATRSGGWAFEKSNVTAPDCDDTGIAMHALGSFGRARRHGDPGSRGDALDLEIEASLRRGAAWLEAMQTVDGGWSAFEPSERPKPRGPMYTAPVGLRLDDLIGSVRSGSMPAQQLGSYAWEDVTARVLLGLGAAGYDVEHPVVWRAREFLRAQQLEHGGWWGRWMVNYLPTTSFVIMGLAAVGDPLDEEWHARAVSFLLEHQNLDGGWGESEETYVTPALAGRGPSVAPLTAIVLSALIAGGRAESPAVSRGFRYLVGQQRDDGSFPNDRYLHAFFPPQSFYRLSLTAFVHPAEALGAWRAATHREQRRR